MNGAFPQYARTTDPAVLAAVERNAEGWRKFHQEALAFSQAQGVENGSYYPSSFAGGHAISAIGGETKPTTGRWKEGYRGGWLPYKSNPLAAELDKIRFEQESVPGLPGVVDGPYNDRGQHYIASPRPFIHGAAVYVGFSWQPIDNGSRNQPKPEEGGWEEIKASEYHAAREAFNDALAQGPTS